ncbi:hypothetical protein A6V39_03990 [Candidatus Mycoplasma haematobovis]|uniref:Uncharacterized protein n=1 Tax=Candidatus Mycoplasma haematobovis TaxID=432608 RepID=A0A1A9QEB8_9MOLU|nr:hypothetical protein [Candidatus Mycoplasma haematobovis]OAL10049.1 hypothetical protein A6V39_03990 [Candidatus Mycoplasma haematobovis]
MSSALRTYVVLSTATILSTLIYRISPFVIHKTTNKEHLTSLGYQYLGNKHGFDSWKVNYSLFQKSLAKYIPEFEKVTDKKEGAYLLKKWCDKNITNSLSNADSFKLVRKHCVVNLKNVILDSPNIRTIDDASPEQRKWLLQNSNGICKSEIRELMQWCVNNFRLANIPKNYGSVTKIKGCCAIDTSSYK